MNDEKTPEQLSAEARNFMQKYGLIITITLLFWRIYNQRKLSSLLKRIEKKLGG